MAEENRKKSKPTKAAPEDDIETERLPKPQRVAVSRMGMVATAHYRATEAGVEMLARGGNAMDAAVAAAFALGVCEPAASGLGGQTMMLVHDAGSHKTVTLDGSSRAPSRAFSESIGGDDILYGHKASTIPSTPAALSYALKRYGTLKLPDVLVPAIRLAEDGFLVTRLLNSLMRRRQKQLSETPAGAFFLRGGKKPYPAGVRFKQPVLAATLRRLADKGIKDFYRGEMARLIHEDMERHGGFIRKDDLAQIPVPVERRPLSAHFREDRILTFPPPGAGRTLVLMLNLVQQLPLRDMRPGTRKAAVTLAEVIRRAFLSRRDRPYDPEHYPQLENKKMLTTDYAKHIAREIRLWAEEHGETTHLSVMDEKGNAVALTQSIERVFGACAAHPQLGFLYNNYMSAFEYGRISHPYYMRPNAVPWASVAPTILFRGRYPYLVIGSPGSERITSSILQVLIRLQHKELPFEAVSAPRLHAEVDRTVSLEATRMRDDIPEALREHGFNIRVRDPYSFYMGCVQLVLKGNSELIGVADPRRDGSAGGPKR